MSKKVNEVISYFENLYNTKSIYLWGCNSEIITKELCDKLYKTYGSSTYNKTYYDNKLKEGQGRIGADCSGAFYPMSGFDTTAQGYYNKCSSKSAISSINRNKPCLVFKGKSTSSINHIGFYLGNGYVIEMKSSKENCVKNKLDDNGWKWFGIPTWIDYSSTSTSNNIQTPTVKCIDVSSYQGSINWSLVKSAGVNYAILRGVTKNGELDTAFEKNYKNATTNGVSIIGTYHFSYALNEETAKNDAINMINKLNGKKIDIYLDLEWDTQRALGKDKVTSIAETYVKTCKTLGYNCHIYSNLDWYKNVYDCSVLKRLGCKFWIARYYNGTNKMSVSIEPNEQYSPKTSLNADIFMWQYTSSGQVSGINGNVDLNIIYEKIHTSNIVTPTIPNAVAETNIELMGKINTQTSSLNIRKEPNTSSAKLGAYKKGAIIQLVAKTSNGWYKTEDGYISNDYISNAMGKVCNCFVLNMRKNPKVETENVIKTLVVNTEAYLLKEVNGWYKVKTKDNVVGYVSGKYIKLL